LYLKSGIVFWLANMHGGVNQELVTAACSGPV
jgi:hypothetical protein